MARVEGSNELARQLRELAASSKDRYRGSVVVGYTQQYAVYVHEDLEAQHPVGQAKFLEQPFRELAGELADIVREALLKGTTMLQALLLAGLRLQRESQELCPVDTGALKASAFTREEDE